MTTLTKAQIKKIKNKILEFKRFLDKYYKGSLRRYDRESFPMLDKISGATKYTRGIQDQKIEKCGNCKLPLEACDCKYD